MDHQLDRPGAGRERPLAPSRILLPLARLAALAPSAWALAAYSGFEPIWATAASLLAALWLAAGARRRSRGLRMAERAVWALFSALFAAALMAGAHIHASSSTAYLGTVSSSYIEPYAPADLLGWALAAAGAYVLVTAAYLVACAPRGRAEAASGGAEGAGDGDGGCPGLFALARRPVPAPAFLLGTLALIAAWTPYLLAYWPGFVFGDTMRSLQQLASGEWSNHFPVLYTAIIGAGLDAAHALGLDRAWGLALVNMVQMAFMAACLSYLSCWAAAHVTRPRPRAAAFLAVLAGFALPPYIATYSVAMWKDPVFSCALAMLALVEADLAIGCGSGGASATGSRRGRGQRRWPLLIWQAVLSLLVIFFRNNGVYIVAALLAAHLVLAACRDGGDGRDGGRGSGRGCPGSVTGAAGHATVPQRLPGRRLSARRVVPCLVLCAVLAVSVAIQGPGYQALGIEPSEKAESLGVPLNQMARVAALGGSMSASDRAFLDGMLPIARYRVAYRPCCTDELKWDPYFDSSQLDDPAFFEHWWSLLLRNPLTYLEAWELQTFGFWDPGYHEAVSGVENIAGGVPRNNGARYARELAREYRIEVHGRVDGGQPAVPSDGPSVPVGRALWAIAFLACCLLLAGPRRLLLSLVPPLALLATLALASPIWYWPRYGLAAQLLLPAYLVLACALGAPCGARRDA